MPTDTSVLTTRSPRNKRHKKGVAGINLSEAQNRQKSDFIKHASNTQLARFVVDPNEIAKVTEDYNFGAGNLKLTS